MHRLVLLLVLPLFLASCGERDAKVLTDTATAAFQARDYKTSCTEFEHALTQMDAAHEQYMRAALGRCLALAHVEPAKGKDEFLKLATAEKARITMADVHLVVSEFVNAGEIPLATDIVVGAQALFPKSAELQKIGNSVLTAAQKVGDPRSSGRLEGHGYVGSGNVVARAAPKTPASVPPDACDVFQDKQFRTVKDTTVGLGENGAIRGRSTISFRNGMMNVQRADAFQTVPFTCSEGRVVARLNEQELRGYYDASKRLLTLNGVEYEPVE